MMSNKTRDFKSSLSPLMFIFLTFASIANASIDPLCGIFTNVLQTRDDPSSINTGEGLVANIYHTPSCALNTGSVYQGSRGRHGLKCGENNATATGHYGGVLDINYTFTVTAPTPSTSASSSSNIIITTNEATLSQQEYNSIKQNWENFNFTLDFNGSKRVNSIGPVLGTVTLSNTAGGDVDIGSFTTKSYGATNLIFDGVPNNIRFDDLKGSSSNRLSIQGFEAKYSIHIDEFIIPRNNTNIVMKAPKVVIDELIQSNTGSGSSTLTIYADEIHIKDVDLKQHAKLIIKPYTLGQRVRFFSDSITASSSSTMILDSGDYYTKSFIIPGTSDVSSIRASDEDQTINLFIDGDFNPGNNPGINSAGNKGNFGANPPANFIMFINGDLGTGGGGTTLNALVYVEGNVTLGSPTHVRGAISSGGNITIGDGSKFYWHDSIDDSGWGVCPPLIQFSSSSYSFDEPAIDGGVAYKIYHTVTVTLDRVVDYNITVQYETFEDSSLGGFSALSGIDYTDYNATLTIPAGSLSVSVSTTILRDELIELSETFNARLTNPLPLNLVSLGVQHTTQLIINAQNIDDVPICFQDDFDTALDDKWRLLHSLGGFIPHLVNDRLRLTNRQKNLSTAVTKDYEFLAKNNLIVLEFDQFAYGGCEAGQSATHGGGLGGYGADGIVMVLFDSEVGDSPQPGGFGGSMGYAQRTGIDGFEQGWLGLGIDEFGNFSNPTEGRVGGPGFYPNNITIRGSSGELSGQTRREGYKYLKSALDIQPVATKKRSPASPGDKYRLRIDSRDSSKILISLYRDEGSGFYNIIPTFDAKESQYSQAPAPEFLRLALTSGTGGGCNNHEIDNLKVRGVCRAYEVINPPQGRFDAWDTFRSIDDRNISTKIVGRDFNLTIASINTDDNALESIENTIIQYRLYDKENSRKLTDWRDFNVSSTASISSEFNSTKAASHARVQFSFCGNALNFLGGKTIYEVGTLPINANGNVIRGADGNVSCDDNLTELSTFSSDGFAIRPKKFTLSSGSTGNIELLTSAKDYNLTLKAEDWSGSFTADYNVTNANDILDINRTMHKKSGDVNNSLHGTLDFALHDFNISDGNASNTVGVNFDDVGMVNIKIVDQNWSNVDIDDTNGSCNEYGRFICGDINATFIPYRFELTDVNQHNHNNGFTYISEDLNMSASVSMTISALNYIGNVTQNFDKNSSWENPVDVNLTIPHRNTTLIKNDINSTSLLGFIEGNTTITSNETNSSKNLIFNFDRNVSSPQEPFDINSTAVNLHVKSTYTAGAISKEVNGTKAANQNTTFYYGRVHAPDYRFVGDTGEVKIFYEVYCDDCDKTDFNITGAESVDSIDWYVNALHKISDGNVSEYSSASGVTFGSPPSGSTSSTSISGGVETVVLTAPKLPHKDKIDMNASSWLEFHPPMDFLVEFHKEGAEWAGEGKLGDTVDINISARQNRRLDW